MRKQSLCREEVEPVLQRFTSQLIHFEFDGAKDTVEDLRAKTSTGTVTENAEQIAWIQLLLLLASLTQAEKSYFALSFLQPKGMFFRKGKESTLKTNYNAIRTELSKTLTELTTGANHSSLEKANEGLSPGGSSTTVGVVPPSAPVTESLVEHLLQQFHAYVTARIDMMNFYEKLTTLATNKGLTIDQAIEMLTELQKKNTGSFHHPFISTLDTAFSYELEVLLHLFQLQKTLRSLKFLQSLFHMKECHSRLKTWLDRADLYQETQASKGWFGFGGSQKNQIQLSLCIWLQKYYESLVSKFSLLFFDVLKRQAPEGDFKQNFRQVPINYPQKIAEFCRKMEAAFFCLMYNAGEDPDYKGLGYQHPGKTVERLSGKESYQVIFMHPPERLHDLQKPTVIMLSNNCKAKSSQGQDKIAYTVDTNPHMTYFAAYVEAELYVIVGFNGSKLESDHDVISFVLDLVRNLRCDTMFNSLKPGAK